ncbi:IclR family transcriptional regulator [Ramlibacter sp.]|uniref:IclR family transcriptional regulator n=1 Tax=Ramlibacter sp. TaxID=1917967 RepID=UPI003D1066ED
MSGRRPTHVRLASVNSAAEPVVESAAAQTLAKGLALLRAFRPHEYELGNKELAERTGLAPSTVSRLAATLMQLSYLRYSRASGKYALGTAVLALVYPMLAGLPIRQVARPLMKALADQVQGQVSIGMAAGGNAMVFVESARSARHDFTLPEVGATIPMLGSAMGRAYIVAHASIAQQALVRRLRQEDPLDWAAHGAKLAQAREDYVRLGFTRSMGDVRSEVHACGLPLKTRVDGEVMVINCSVTAAQLRRGGLELDIGPALVRTARDIDIAMAGDTLQRRKARVDPTVLIKR